MIYFDHPVLGGRQIVIRGFKLNEGKISFCKKLYCLSEVVKFLFGEGAVVTQDCVNNHYCIRISGSSYVLNNSKTLNADFIITELNTTEVFK